MLRVVEYAEDFEVRYSEGYFYFGHITVNTNEEKIVEENKEQCIRVRESLLGLATIGSGLDDDLGQALAKTGIVAECTFKLEPHSDAGCASSVKKIQVDVFIPDGIQLPYHNVLPESISRSIFGCLLDEFRGLQEQDCDEDV